MRYALAIAFGASILAGCDDLGGLNIARLVSPIENTAELLTVTPTRTMTHQGDGLLADGRSINPVLSRSLREFDTVKIEFPDDTTETLNGTADYNIFAWRKVAKNLGEGELLCDVAPSVVVDPGALLLVTEAGIRLGIVAATFAPAREKLLVTTYDSDRGNRLVSMEFRSNDLISC